MSAFLGEFSPHVIQNGLLLLVVGEAVLLGAVMLLFMRQRRQNADLRVFFTGKEAKNLERVLLDQLTETRELDREIQELFGISNQLRELCLKSLHKTSVVRFNPFKEVGGNQSFSVALLDGKNSGVILSSFHTREGTRVYAKPVQGGQQNGFPLTEEEKQAIDQAITGKTTPIV
jgi:hypothetical protein